MAKKIKKMHFHGGETLFERKGKIVKDIKTGKKAEHKSINRAKAFCRKQVDLNGLDSVVVIS